MDPRFFRTVLGNFPTGVVAVTSMSDEGKPVGMAIGSFTSVSLDPPLVAFLPDRSSSTWPLIRAAGRFCVNFLASDQEYVCRALASKGGDKFAGVPWRPASNGAPLIDGSVGWIECEIETVHGAGDHDIVIGRVLDLNAERDTLPLLFFQGGYGRFEPLSLSAWADDLSSSMTMADIARPHMEELSSRRAVECVTSAVVGPDMVLTAAAGVLNARRLTSRVGNRIPFEPPLGTVFAAFGTDALRDLWLKRAARHGEEFVEMLDTTLTSVREEGYSLDLGYDWHAKMEDQIVANGARQRSATAREEMVDLIAALAGDYESPAAAAVEHLGVGTINVPVIGASQVAGMSLSILGRHLDASMIEGHVRALRETAANIAAELKRASLG